MFFLRLSIGENYTEVVYAAYDINPVYMLYFVILALFGMFLVIGMVTGFFELGMWWLQAELLCFCKNSCPPACGTCLSSRRGPFITSVTAHW